MSFAWWCSGLSNTNWTWSPSIYPGIWILVGVFFFSYFRFINPSINNKQSKYFLIGMILFWIFTDWPIGPLGAGYLLSLHILQYLIYTFVVAPLLILSIPKDIYEKIFNSKFAIILKNLFLPFLIINISLVITHIPFIADSLKASQIGTMIIDLTWIFSALLFWLWIDPKFDRNHFIAFPLRIFFVFALSILPAIPGAFFVFNSYPIYATYEFAVPMTNLSPFEDQEIAGLIMWAGSTPILLFWLGRIFYIWEKNEEQAT